MRAVVCLDEMGGMMFNHRRQSRDSTVIADVIASLGVGRLLLAPYSEKLFMEAGADYVAEESFLSSAGKKDTCFVEDRHLAQWAERIDELVIYRWNRRYPADLYLDISPEALGFSLRETAEWQGTSHEKITKEIFVK